MTIDLTNRVALVTGGARGIGAGIVSTLARAGVRVMVADIGVDAASEADWNYSFADDADLKALMDTANEGQIKATHVDVTKPSSCKNAVQATIGAFGSLDILINNAGIVDSGGVANFDPDTWDKIFAVNTKGIFLMTQAALPHLEQSTAANIVNTASIAGKTGYANMSAYCGSKFAAIGITQSLAAELAPAKIRVNAICPGMVGTAMWLEHLLPTNATDKAQKNEEFEAAMANTIPLGRPQTSDDMAEAVRYLVSAENVTGISLVIAGGFEVH